MLKFMKSMITQITFETGTVVNRKKPPSIRDIMLVIFINNHVLESFKD